jgi:hypothetical protein
MTYNAKHTAFVEVARAKLNEQGGRALFRQPLYSGSNRVPGCVERTRRAEAFTATARRDDSKKSGIIRRILPIMLINNSPCQRFELSVLSGQSFPAFRASASYCAYCDPTILSN